jgi:tetratricopeptide (TPR) repeat protein
VATLQMLGTAHLRLGQLQEAQDVLLRAYRLAQSIELRSEDRRSLEFNLAQALVADPSQRERALELARKARARSDAATTEIDSFLATHRD